MWIIRMSQNRAIAKSEATHRLILHAQNRLVS